MNFRQAGIAVLTLFLAVSSAFLAWSLPNWLPAIPAMLLAAAVALAFCRRNIGFSIGLGGLFGLFLFAIAYVVGDAEESLLVYSAMPRYGWLVFVSWVFLVLAWVLRRAQTHEQPSSRS